MHQPFLEQLAEKIRTSHSGLGSRLCIVMPNRRAGLFLKRYLVPKDQKPVWAPSVFSIEDFISRVGNLNVPDPLTLLFGLYEAHCSVEKENASGFDDFAGWSRGLIRDFEEIDQYLIDPAGLFGFLSETKAMSLWNLDGQPLTDFEKQYLRFFSSLSAYYEYFKTSLLKTGQAYHGLACRQVAENPMKYLDPLPWDFVLFAGFNAITPAQLTIIRYLISNGKAEITWEADSYYIENPSQEAGRFLRTYLKDKTLGNPGTLSHFFETGQKEIHLAGVPRNIGQTRLAGNILKKLIESGGQEILNKTAVVLADESLLLPLLNAIPAEAGSFNITMGYPLQQSPLYVFFDGLLSMHLNASSGKNPGFSYFYYKDVLALLQHPYTPIISGSTWIKDATDSLRSGKSSYVKLPDIFKNQGNSSSHSTELSILFSKINSPAELTKLMISGVEMLRTGMEKRNPELEVNYGADGEILFNLALILNRLHTMVVETGLVGELRTLQSLFREAAASTPVPFYGEPLEGVQVMGMLETRTLDFENVILLSANEDTLPSRKSYNSFIPFDIRQNFGLPTHQDQQAVFAYHFYRLLQRCNNAWLIYNSEADELGGGEKSRFLSQVQTEMPAVNPEIMITEVRPSSMATINQPFPISIEKTPEIVEKLNKLAGSGFSPTSLSTYLACPLKYYFQFVLRLGEPGEADETIDYRTLGNVIHKVLQDFYTPFTGKMPQKSDFEQMQAKAADAIAEKLKKEFPGGDVTSGRNLLIVKVANVWINRFLSLEAGSNYNMEAGDRILALEESLKTMLQLDLPGNEVKEIVLKGYADRIDHIRGITRIIDYKTGKVDAAELKPKTVESLFEPSARPKEKAFQLLFYLFLAGKSPIINNGSSNVEAGIISFRSLKEEFLPLIIPGNDQHAVLQEFEQGLKNLLAEIYEPSVPFAQTELEEHCSLCPFKTICHKTEEKKGW
jgi:CRISPR/Cas system-associated exonuclease Cas4 (RecB family)